MTNATATHIETVPPRFSVGDTVRFQGRAGCITRVYPASGVPTWFSTRLLLHTHCYEISTSGGPVYGLVDAELTEA